MPQAGMSSESQKNRHARRTRLPLYLLLAALLIAASGVLLQTFTPRARSLYHTHMLRVSLLGDDYEAGRRHLNALPWPLERHAEALRQIAAGLNENTRTWLAEQLFMQSGASLSDPPVWTPPRAVQQHISDLPLFRLAMDLDPESTFGLTVSAREAYEQEDYVRAERLSRQLIELARAEGGPPAPQDLRRLAECLIRQDQFVEAEARLLELTNASYYAFRSSPNDLRLLAEVRERLGKYRDAIRVLTRFYEILPPMDLRSDVLLSRARQFAFFGRLDLAEKDMRAALSRIASDEIRDELRMRWARTLTQIGEHDEAIELLDELVRTYPARPALRLARMDAFFAAGQYEKAYAEGQEIILLDAGEPALYNQVAWRMITAPDPEDRRPQEALRLARICVKLDEQRTPAYLDTLAEALYGNGFFDEAVATERLAIKRGGDLFAPSLERFLRAADRARQGLPVEIDRSPLVHIEPPPVGDRREPFDLNELPPIPRLEPGTAHQALSTAGSLSNLDAAAKALATHWAAVAPAATDDPRCELHVFATTLMEGAYRSSFDRPRALYPLHPFERDFLSGLAKTTSLFDARLSSTGRTVLLDNLNRLSRGQWALPRDNPAEIGASIGRQLVRMRADQAERILQRIAKGELLLSELFRTDYYGHAMVKRVEGSDTMRSVPTRSSDFLRAWPKIEARLRAAAKAGELTPATPAPDLPDVSGAGRGLFFPRNGEGGLRPPPGL